MDMLPSGNENFDFLDSNCLKCGQIKTKQRQYMIVKVNTSNFWKFIIHVLHKMQHINRLIAPSRLIQRSQLITLLSRFVVTKIFHLSCVN
jgi:hypothetical protein